MPAFGGFFFGENMPNPRSKSITWMNQAGGQYRTITKEGRTYLVVPGVPVREQVMNNYLVPADEITHFLASWNGIPITLRHPNGNDGSANAPEPDVPVIGRFFNAAWDAKMARMTGEYWIDIQAAQAVDGGPLILNAIRAGQMIETSTGYWADEDYTPGEHDGKGYDLVHRNLRPDHIAILPDQAGACSLKDGCGLNRNYDPSQPRAPKGTSKGGQWKRLGAEVRTPQGDIGIIEEIGKDASGKSWVVVGGTKPFEGYQDVDRAYEIDDLEPTNYQEMADRYNVDVRHLRSMEVDFLQNEGYLERGGEVHAFQTFEEYLRFATAKERHRVTEPRQKGDLIENSLEGEVKTNTHSASAVRTGTAKSRKENTVNEQVRALLAKLGVKANAAGQIESVDEKALQATIDQPAMTPEEVTAMKALVSNLTEVGGIDGLVKAITMATNAAAQETAKKQGLVDALKANNAHPFNEDDLNGMSICALTRLNESLNVDWSGTGPVFQNAGEDENELKMPAVFLAKAEKES